MLLKMRGKGFIFFIVVFILIVITIIPAVAIPAPALYITGLAWSPDGHQIAVGLSGYACLQNSDGYAIKILDALSQQVIQRLPGNACDVTSMNWSSDGTKLAVSTLHDDGTYVWNVKTGKLVLQAQASDGISSIKWKPFDNFRFARVSMNTSIDMVDIRSGETLRLPHTAGDFIDWSPDGTKLLSGSSKKNQIYVTDMGTNQQIMELKGHEDPITDVDWSPDGNKFATVSRDLTMRIWDAKSGKTLRTIDANGSQILWNPDNRRIATVSYGDNNVHIRDTFTGKWVESFVSQNRVYAIDWSPDGTKLVMGGSGTKGQEPEIRIADAHLSLATLTPTPLPPPIYITHLVWSPSGSQIAVGHGSTSCGRSSNLYTVQILDSVNLQVAQTLNGSTCNITSLDWNAEGTSLAASSLDNIGMRIWDTQNGQLLAKAEEDGQGISSVKWRPSNSQELATVSDDSYGYGTDIRIFDISTGETKILTAGGPSIDWSPDGSKLVMGRTDNLVYIVDGVTGQEIRELKGHTDGITAVDWSPDGHTIASSSYDGTVRIWDASSGQPLLTFSTDNVIQLQWSPDSQKLVTINYDGVAQVWDTATQQQLFSLEGKIAAIAWSPDGQKLVYGINGINGQEPQVHIVDVQQVATATPTATLTGD